MDILSLITNKDLQTFTANYNYTKNFMGQKLFTPEKTSDIKARIVQLVEGGNLPVMALAHAFDTEARIGDRPAFNELIVSKTLIKEKINTTERIAEYLANAKEDVVKNFVLNDVGNMMSRVLTRTEVANIELLATGKVTYKENNLNTVVDYGFNSTTNEISISGWNAASADILGDLENIMTTAQGKGYILVRAFTSSKMLGYMLNNTAIQGYWANKAEPLTKARLISWINENYGIEFVVNDAMYKNAANGSGVYRFFPEDRISFVPTKTALGKGLFGYTPEELQLSETSEQSFVTVTSWEQKDPACVYTKASALYVPVITDINGLFIAKHTATT